MPRLFSFRYVAAFDRVDTAIEMVMLNRDLIRLLKSQTGSVRGESLL
jgi:hypothetical protein